MVLFSCSDLLEEKPTSFVSPTNFYRNASDANIALTGVYDMLHSVYNSNVGFAILWGDHGTDLMTHRPGHPALTGSASYTLTSQYTQLNNLWVNTYELINRANSVIDRVPAIEMDETEKNRIIGEALFLRAHMYFNLVMAWGDVPLVVEETTSLENLDVSRTPSTEVYDQIIEDLIQAEGLLPNTAGNERATAGAAKALLGKVYLQMSGNPLNDVSKLPLASAKLKEVMDDNVYMLLDDYSEVFALDNEDNNEIMFAVQYAAGIQQGGSLTRIYGPFGSFVNGGAIDFHRINTEFANSFDTIDTRLAQNVAKINVNTGNAAAWRPWKWIKPLPVTYGEGDGPQDFPLLRFADVLLMYAEAQNAINNGPNQEAYNAINMIRNRAGLDDLTTGLSQEEFLDALLQERAWELCYEGHRRADLIRNGKLLEKVQAIPSDTQQYGNYVAAQNIREFHLLWPIPLREIDLNPNLEQNPNY
jgi:hypothetical protein